MRCLAKAVFEPMKQAVLFKRDSFSNTFEPAETTVENPFPNRYNRENDYFSRRLAEKERTGNERRLYFCKITNGEIPSGTVYEDEDFRVILDISPAAKGHCLILPKQHGKNLLEMDDAVLAKVFPLAKKIGQAMVKATGAKGFNVVQNNGEAAGQTVEHFHVHIIPRFDAKDSMVLWTPLSYEEGELEKVKESIVKEIHG